MIFDYFLHLDPYRNLLLTVNFLTIGLSITGTPCFMFPQLILMHLARESHLRSANLYAEDSQNLFLACLSFPETKTSGAQHVQPEVFPSLFS